MAILDVKCNIERDKRPHWMANLIQAINNAMWKSYQGTEDELNGIRSGIDHFIRQLKMSGQTFVNITTELSNNIISIKRNGKTFITVQFQ